MRAIELFAGGGGLAAAGHAEGVEHKLMVEWDKWSCKTLRYNFEEYNCSILNEDIRNIDFSIFENTIDLVTGGPPCQPFSLGGVHKGDEDNRDMFPEAIRVVKEVKPKAFVFENVKGLTRDSFKNYLSLILLRLTYPEVYNSGMTWIENLSFLEKHHIKGAKKSQGLSYRLVWRVLNSADFGAPQIRERLVIVGIRSDLNAEFSFPNPTHSKQSLIYDQVVSKEYWKRHQIKIKQSIYNSSVIEFDETCLALKPWMTTRDAIASLPKPRTGKEIFPNHELKPGAKSYKGHTGSILDAPAKTIKAGVHGVPGGENTVVLDSGDIRYFTAREAARVQTFPDSHIFIGAWSEAMRQIGNAVPVEMLKPIISNLKLSLSR